MAVGCAGPQLRKGELPKAISVVEEPSRVAIAPDVRDYFVRSVEEQLFESGQMFVRGKGLTLRWKVTEAERGSRALRYLVGFGAGQARFRVLATIVDEKNRVLASKELGGTQTMGMVGGSSNGAVRDAADQVAFFVEDEVYRR